MDSTSAEKEINRIERELDAANSPAGKPPEKRGGSNAAKPSKSLDAVLVTVVLLFVFAVLNLLPGIRVRAEVPSTLN